MGFGINNKIKDFTPKILYQKWKRYKVYKNNKEKNIKMGLGCSINNVTFGNYNYLGNNVTLLNTSLGDYSYINSNTKIRNTKIGKFCSIASEVKIVLGWHPTGLISTHPAFYSTNKLFKTFSRENYFKEYRDVKIGNDVWIGEEVMIPGGIKIGDGAVIAARSVVTKDVPPYAVVGGIPGKIIKYRFKQEEINFLLDFKWWDKEEKWFEENHTLFLDKIIFFKLYKSKLKL